MSCCLKTTLKDQKQHALKGQKLLAQGVLLLVLWALARS